MNESIKKKINGIGEAGNVVSIILIVLTALGCLCLIAALIVFTLLPKDAVTLGLQIDADAIVGKSLIGPYLDDIDLSDVEDLDVGITEEGLRAGFSTDRLNVPSGRLAYGILAAIAKALAKLVVLIILNKLSREFKNCDTPFADGVIRWMTVFAWVLLGASVFSQVASSTAAAMIFPSGGVQVNLNLTMVFVTLVVLFLTMIFRYGAKLQHEADETL